MIRDGEDFLELKVTDRGADLQSVGDARFSLRVQVSSKDTVFSAETWCWVEATVLA